MRKTIFFLLCFFASTFIMAQPFLVVGTYTSGASEGIYVYKFNQQTGAASLVSTAKTSNPSYLAISPNEQYVYAVNENADTTGPFIGGSVAAFAFSKSTGLLTAINQLPSMGKHPCYITTSSNGRWVVVGNYSSGTVAVLPVQKNGGLGKAAQVVQHTGSGPNKARQQSAHVHGTVLTNDDQYLLVPDLGMDKVVVYRFSKAAGKLTPLPKATAQTTPGSGPRHLVLDAKNKYAYLTEELTGNVTVFRMQNGQLTAVQTLSAHPQGYTGDISSADIHLSPDGRFLYCSNRGGSNTIAIFKVDAKNGQLRLVAHQPTLGIKPRNFNFDPSGNFLLVANQETGQIVVFKTDKKTGLLTDTGNRIDVPSPVCLKWINGSKK
jgi:6-phosphogluconolactonase